MYKIFISLTLIVLLTGCSSGNGNKDDIDIFDGTYDNVVFAKDSFAGLEFKFSKEYDVSELPDALEAHYGFFKRREFEIRFYPSNQIAKSSGIFFAEEATGEDRSGQVPAGNRHRDRQQPEGLEERRREGIGGEAVRLHEARPQRGARVSEGHARACKALQR